jgi:hypothetical protein
MTICDKCGTRDTKANSFTALLRELGGKDKVIANSDLCPGCIAAFETHLHAFFVKKPDEPKPAEPWVKSTKPHEKEGAK